jgi:adenylate kinase
MAGRARKPGRGAGRYIALAGTPGTGKSAVAAALSRGSEAIEVADLARQAGAATGRGRQSSVDLVKLARWLRTHRARPPVTFVVGHLAHLLPIQEVVLLRCHPLTLEVRLRRARRGRARERAENVAAEAIDLLLLEALAAGRTVRELDTTRARPRALARAIEAWVQRPVRARYGTVDWLADRRVTDWLFHRARYPGAWSSKATGPGRRRGSSASRGRSSAGRRTG